MTINELEATIRYAARKPRVYVRFDDLELSPSLLLEALEQIKRSIMSIQSGITEPKDHRAESLLLMILNYAIDYKGIPVSAPDSVSPQTS